MEALHRAVVAGEILRQELESDVPAETEVLGVVDDAHSSAAKFAEDAIVRDGFVDHARGGGMRDSKVRKGPWSTQDRVARACIVNFHTTLADVEATIEIAVRMGREVYSRHPS